MIFRRIDDFREKLNLELVCRRWRKIMLKHGWKHLRQVVNTRNHLELTPHKWAVPIGERCGNRLVECSLYSLDIDSNLVWEIRNLQKKRLDNKIEFIKEFLKISKEDVQEQNLRLERATEEFEPFYLEEIFY